MRCFMSDLGERKEKILQIIIQNYLETGEPVGSRTISKLSDMGLSSATIRNEMSDLEELGYIVQPHTSAGRIPTDLGYRFYVDHLMAVKDQEVEDLKDMVIEKTERMEKMLRQVAKVLAANTQYATMISAPSASAGRLKFIQLSQVNDHQILSVVVMGGNLVKNKIIEVDNPLDNETMLKLNMLLNTCLNGLTVMDINLGMVAQLKEQAGIHEDIVAAVLDSVVETVREDEDFEIYTSGATNIFKYPELADSEKAGPLLTAFEEKDKLAELISDVQAMNDEGGTGIQVYIGEESPMQTMKDYSMVTANYDLGDGVKGTIGIIGPKRMDYAKVMANLKSLKGQLDNMLSEATIVEEDDGTS